MPAHFEPHYQINADLQLYTGISGESIDFPDRAAAEIDLYSSVRPTLDKLAAARKCSADSNVSTSYPLLKAEYGPRELPTKGRRNR